MQKAKGFIREGCGPKNKYLYVMVSRTPTKTGYIIRKIGHVKYNHTSVALDEALSEMYGFSRRQHNTLLIAGLMHETLERFTLRKYSNIDVIVFRIPVSDRQYDDIKRRIYEIERDSEYLYNYISVLTYPFMHGLETYKAFTCAEFVMFLLKSIGFVPDKRLCSYTPDDMLSVLSGFIYFKGNLLDYSMLHSRYVMENGKSGIEYVQADVRYEYFAPIKICLIKESFVCACRIVARTLCSRLRRRK